MAVRRESVRLELQDAGFSTGMARAAAATALLEGRLDSLDGVSIRAHTSVGTLGDDVDTLGTVTRKAGPDIDRYSGRLRLLADAAAVLGPSLVPIGAVAVPAITGLASQLGFAALGMGSLVASFQGVGDALTAVNDAALEPTAENLQKARDAMRLISPDARDFVKAFQDFRPVLNGIRDAGAAGWFPGLTESLDHFEDVAPRVADIFQRIGEVGGNLVSEAAESLAGPEWSQFLDFVAREAPPALEELGRSVGDVAAGMADLWMAFAPLNSSFSGWMLDASRGFAEWADGLSQTEGFQDFVAYIQTNGPRVADLAASIGSAFLEIAEAAAPLGGPVLEALTAIANLVAAIADSPLGTPILAAYAATALWNRALTANVALQRSAMGTKSIGSLRELAAAYTTVATAAQRANTPAGQIIATQTRQRAALGATLKAVGPTAAAFAALTLSSNEATSSLVGTNQALGAMIGSMGGPVGLAVGAVAGQFLDMRANIDQATEAIESNNQALINSMFEQRAGSYDDWYDFFDPRAIRTAYEDAFTWATTGESTTESLGKAVGGLAARYDPAASAAERFAARGQRLNTVLREQQAAARETAQGFFDLSAAIEEPTLSLDRLMTRMERQAAAARDYGENLRQALANGADPEALQRLIDDLGPAAGLALQQLVRGGRRAAQEFNQSFGEMERAGRRLSGAIGDVSDEITGTTRRAAQNAKDAFDSLPKDVRTRIRADGIPQTKAQVDGLVEKYELTEAERQALITLKDMASGRIQSIINLIGNVRDKTVTITTIHRTEYEVAHPNQPGDTSGGAPGIRGQAEGGTVLGRRQPYGDKVLSWLAPGEEVISNRFGQADRHRALLKAINANRLADGGTAQRAPMERHAVTAARTSVSLDTSSLRMVGTLDTPWGPARVEGIARAAARDEIDQNATFERQQRMR